MGDFQGTDRIHVRRSIGSGSFGMVFEVFDQDRQAVVALKTLTNVGPEALYQFKQEFRALADISHPNLVGLFELGSDGDRAYFTMELIDGLPFSAWVRNERPTGRGAFGGRREDRTSGMDEQGPAGIHFSDSASHAVTGEEPTMFADSGPSAQVPDTGEVKAIKDPARLRNTLRQLVNGVSALHASGKLHRDLKSSNVLVTPAGRLVILDFGLVLDISPHEAWAPGLPPKLVGTPSHISPEQVAGQRADEASDWYAVGVMLYESLTGRLPFTGSPMAMLQAKQELDPPRPATIAPGVPDDLDEICVALLNRNPRLRMGRQELMERLGHPGTVKPGAWNEPGSQALRRIFVGRAKEVSALRAAFESTVRDEPSTVLLHGSSGIGKSFLVRRFLRSVQEDNPRAVVLYGRCFEQESVPFKAVDSLIDGLSQVMRFMPSVETEPLLPRHIGALAKLFPVLQQVPSIARAAARSVGSLDALETRQRAFSALRALLSRLADQRPLVLVLDDLQWGDLDSVALLGELLRPPDRPAFLLVACYRREESGTSPALLELLPMLKSARHVDLPVEPLDAEASAQLALSLMGPERPGHDDHETRARNIADEAGGSPLFISELARHPGGAELLPATGTADLERLLLIRVQMLPEISRQILELLAVAGYPLPWSAVRRAVKAEPGQADPFAPLRAGHLARARGTSDHRTLEVYHDRVGEAVARSLGAEAISSRHLMLAEALEQSPGADPQALAQHYLAGGERGKAADFSSSAADLAAEALAFDQAATLYQQAIDLRQAGDPSLQDLRIRLAQALVNTGRGAAAAQVFLDAASHGDSPSHRVWRRRAAEEFFRSGHLEQGLATTRQVLAAIGVRIPATPTGALVSLVFHRLRLYFRGIKFTERSAEAIPAELLDRIDTLWSVTMGLGLFDFIRAADFQARQLLLALEAGEPYRLVRGLAHEMALRAAESGSGDLSASRRIQATTMALAERFGQPEPLARAYIGAGIAALVTGRWRSSADWLEKAETVLRASCTGVTYEIHTVQFFAFMANIIMGRIRPATQRYPELLSEAEDLGDVLMLANLRIVGWNIHLAADDPELAETEMDRALEGWPETGFLTQHFHRLIGRASVHLYRGQPRAALDFVQSQWPALKGSHLLRSQSARISCVELRARCLLATAAAEPANRAALLKAARRDIQSLFDEPSANSKAQALKDQAVALALEGRNDEAQASLVEAEISLENEGMATHVQAVRWVRGHLLGNAQGQDLKAAATAAMKEAGYRNPEATARLFAPGIA
ncbi:MAG: AAA family ATPase [Holophagaceae bacterium]|nr:AAA family ATPase [Holophagaceae bacterium]